MIMSPIAEMRVEMMMHLSESLALAVMKILGLHQKMQVDEELASHHMTGAMHLQWLELLEVHLVGLRWVLLLDLQDSLDLFYL
jgi:hypothetical protein